ncbi:MAG: hypothetical protein ACK5GN_07490 [Pseudomonadota bacterium]|jgi:hypothetical protein
MNLLSRSLDTTRPSLNEPTLDVPVDAPTWRGSLSKSKRFNRLLIMLRIQKLPLTAATAHSGRYWGRWSGYIKPSLASGFSASAWQGNSSDSYMKVTLGGFPVLT